MHHARFSSKLNLLTHNLDLTTIFQNNNLLLYYCYHYCYSLLSCSNTSLGQRLSPENQKHLLSLLSDILMQVSRSMVLTTSVYDTDGISGSVITMM